MAPGTGFWSRPGRKAAAGHAAILVVTLWFGGPWSTLWAFLAESAGLTLAWFILAAAGRLPFSIYAVAALPVLLAEMAFLHGQLLLMGILWEPRTTGLLPPVLDLAFTVYVVPLVLAIAATVTWVAWAGKPPAATGPLVPSGPATRAYPAPLGRLVWFQVSFVAAWVVFAIVLVLQFAIMVATGGSGIGFETAFRIPLIAAGLLVGMGAIVLDLLEARMRPTPVGKDFCPNCRSTALLGRKPAFCLRCGAVLPQGTVSRGPGP